MCLPVAAQRFQPPGPELHVSCVCVWCTGVSAVVMCSVCDTVVYRFRILSFVCNFVCCCSACVSVSFVYRFHFD